MKNLFYFYCIFLISLLGCNNSSSDKQSELTYDVEMNNNITYPLFNFMTVNGVVSLETNDNSLIKSIDRIKISDDLIFIFTNRDIVKVFSHKGKYLYNIGRKGKGPEELLMATDFDISPDKKKIAIWDRNRSELKLFKTDGSFIKSVKSKKIQWVFRVCWLSDNRFLLSSLYRPQAGKQYQIYMLDENLMIIKGMIPYYKNLERWGITGPVFTKESTGTVHYRHPLGTDVYKVNNDANKIYNISFGENQTNKSDFEKFSKNSKLLFVSPKAIVIRYLEIDKYIYFRYQFENRSYSLIINKETKKQIRYNHSNPFDFLSSIAIIGVYNNQFVGKIDPYKLIDKISTIKKSDMIKYKKEIEHWKNVIKDKKDSDNPILIFMTPKI